MERLSLDNLFWLSNFYEEYFSLLFMEIINEEKEILNDKELIDQVKESERNIEKENINELNY